MNILVLEDDHRLRFALSEFLEDCGHVVQMVEKIGQACDALKHFRPDVLLLDLMIGTQTSIQVTGLAEYRCPDAEVVFLTGSQMFPNGELFEQASNAAIVLRKPVNFHDLQEMILHIERTRAKAA